LAQQRSDSPCTRGTSWDYDDRGIWVDNGCRADFAPALGGYPDRDDRYRDNSMNNNRGGRIVGCASDDGGKHYCNAETRAGVKLVQQRSESACTRGYSWDFDDRGIWVDHGCRADFQLETGPDYSGNGGGNRRSCASSVGEQRSRQLVEQCLQVSSATHPPCNAQNECRLITDEIRRSCQMLGNNAPGFCDEYR
jgi:hypothetical protein